MKCVKHTLIIDTVCRGCIMAKYKQRDALLEFVRELSDINTYDRYASFKEIALYAAILLSCIGEL